MKIKLLIFVFLNIILGCNSVKYGIYESSCKMYNRPELILVLKKDSTFEYRRQYLDEPIKGTWKLIKKNQLELKAQLFLVKDTINPDYKYTEYENDDLYKVEGNKLLIYYKNGEFSLKKCYLKRLGNVPN